jgi:hypothetical protein
MKPKPAHARKRNPPVHIHHGASESRRKTLSAAKGMLRA